MRFQVFINLLFLAFLSISCVKNESKKNQESQKSIQASHLSSYNFFIGAYTRKEGHVNGKGKGIYRATLNTDSLSFSKPILVAKDTSPSFLALHPKEDILFAVNEYQPKVGNESFIKAYSIKDSKLHLLDRKASGGTYACHVAVSDDGKSVGVANYFSGKSKIYTWSNNKFSDTSSLQNTFFGMGPNKERQEASHLHQIVFGPNNHYAYVCDLGADKIYIIDLKSKENDPREISVKPGDGPRHMALHPNGKTAYLLNELSGTLVGFEIQNDGMLKQFMRSQSFGRHSAEILVHPNRKYLYAGFRGNQNQIVGFQINEDYSLTKEQEVSTEGKTPRNFAISPDGKYMIVANQDSSSLVLFKINSSSGQLIKTNIQMSIPTPACVVFKN